MRIPLLALCLAPALVLSACSDADPGLDFTNPQVVFRASMEAIHDGDWASLETLLTNKARVALAADLRRVQKNLASPRPGSPLMATVELRLGPGYEAEVRRAVEGGLPELLRFFVKLSPRPREPAQRGVRIDPATLSMEFLYETSAGEQRPVKLIQARGRWYVAALQL